MSRITSKRAFEQDDFDFNNQLKKIEEPILKPYEPKTTQDLIKNKKNIRIIKDILANASDTKPIILLRGSIGCGKATLLKLCIKESGFRCMLYNQEFETLDEFIEISTTSGIDQFFGLNPKRAIIIKDFDTVSRTLQTEYIKFLLKEPNIIPIFLTTSNMKFQINKKIPTLDFEEPTNFDLIKLSNKILPNQSEADIFRIQKLALKCSGDIRHFEEMLAFYLTKLSDNNDDDSEDDNMFVEQDLDQYKDISYDNVKEELEKISLKTTTFHNKIRLSSLHTNSVLQENYPTFIIDSSLTSINEISKISNLISISDLYYNYIAINGSWDDIDLSNYNYITGTIWPLSIIRKRQPNGRLKISTIKYSSPNPKLVAFKKYQELLYILKNILTNPKDYPTFIEEIAKDTDPEIINMICLKNPKLKDTYNRYLKEKLDC